MFRPIIAYAVRSEERVKSDCWFT